MKYYKLDAIKVGDPGEGTTKTGRPYVYTDFGFMIKGAWYNERIFKPEDIEFLKSFDKGDEIPSDVIELYDKPHEDKVYKKFKLLKNESHFKKETGSQTGFIPHDEPASLEAKLDSILHIVKKIYEEVKSPLTNEED